MPHTTAISDVNSEKIFSILFLNNYGLQLEIVSKTRHNDIWILNHLTFYFISCMQFVDLKKNHPAMDCQEYSACDCVGMSLPCTVEEKPDPCKNYTQPLAIDTSLQYNSSMLGVTGPEGVGLLMILVTPGPDVADTQTISTTTIIPGMQRHQTVGLVFTKGLRLSQVIDLNPVLKLRLLSHLSFVLKQYSQRVTLLSPRLSNHHSGFLCHVTILFYSNYTIGDMYPSFNVFYLRKSAEMENLVTTYKLPKDCFSEVFCVIILYLQPFQILKWRKVYGGHI